jgi:autocrine motility factor receptor
MESARRLPCSHLFHLLVSGLNCLLVNFVRYLLCRSCLRSWLEQDTSCPTCRVSLGDSQRQPEQNNLAQEMQRQTQQPPMENSRNSVWEFDGTRLASWLPVLSVEVVRGQPGQRAQPVPRVQPRNILPANDAVVNDMARQVLAVLPHVPRNVIVADLQQTGSVQQTINNFLDFTIPQVEHVHLHVVCHVVCRTRDKPYILPCLLYLLFPVSGTCGPVS